MSDPFVAEIRMFPYNFAPRGWAFCNGQLIPLSQNTALFSLLGTTYGGNGKSNFALPNVEGRAVLHPGQRPGGSAYRLGETGGSAAVALLDSEMPAHDHAVNTASGRSTANNFAPGPTVVLANSVNASAYTQSGSGAKPMSENAIAPAGGSQPHNNLMPYLTVHFCIALQGIFPPRT